MSLSLLFRANRGFSSWAIEFFGAGGYSHVDIIWPDGRLFGARTDHPVNGKTGVQFRPADYEIAPKTTRISVPCTLAQEQMGLEWAKQQEGLPYDRLAIIAFGTGRDWRTEDAWFCSELATRFLEIALGFELPIPISKITPGTCACIAGALSKA
jgi:uncharacterized protein YycO